MTTWGKLVIVGTFFAFVASPGRTQQTSTGGGAVACDPGNACITGGMCQPDGSCSGSPRPNGTACDDGNSCTTGDTCQGGTCTAGANLPDGAACTIPFAGACASDPRCMSVPLPGVPPFCVPSDFVECDAGDPCNPNVCDPRDGQCKRFSIECDDDCSTAQCDPGSGECVNRQPRSDGTSCDDFNECTGNDRCTGGQCRGTGGTVNTPTFTSGVATATASRTHTAAANTATRTVTSTAAASSTATRTQTPSGPTFTPPPPGGCFGDCNDDGEITIDELVRAVNIALGTSTVEQCNSIDANGDGEVTIDELVKAVNAALNGCVRAPTRTHTPPPSATSSATSTATPTATAPPATSTASATSTAAAVTATASATATHSSTPAPGSPTATHTHTLTPTAVPQTATTTHTATPAEDATDTPTPEPDTGTAERAAGVVAASTEAMLRLPEAMSVVLRAAANLPSGGALTFGQGGGGGAPIAFDCKDGGSISVTCNQQVQGFPPVLSPPMYELFAQNCRNSSVEGQTTSIDGSIFANGTEAGQVCFIELPTSFSLSIPSFSIIQTGTNRSTVSIFSGVSGSLALGSTDENCGYSELDLILSGRITVQNRDATGATLSSTQATFANTGIGLDILTFEEGCTPSFYQMAVNGPITFVRGGNTAAITYANFLLQAIVGGDSTSVEVGGGVSSACFGGDLTLATPELLVVPAGNSCPVDGEVTAAHDSQTDRILYTESGGVDIDAGDDGVVDASFPACYDPRLFMCGG